MDEKKVPKGWTKVDRGRIVFDDVGRMKILSTCKCGGPVWLKQGKAFKKWFTGRCSSCGTMVIARIRKVAVSHDEAMEDECRIRDIDALVSHLTDVAVREIDPVMYDAAEMLLELNEKHWSECWQIGVYSDTDEKAKRLVKATTMNPPTIEDMKDSAKLVIWTESDLEVLKPDN